MKNFFKKFPEIYTALSEKRDGSMKISKKDNKNRDNYFQKEGLLSKKIISAGLENKTNVAIVNTSSLEIIQNTDSLVTNEKNIFLSITVADCIPVFFYDRKNKVIAIAHAGWRGIVGGIIKYTVNKIQEVGGSIENLYVGLGPGIGACHFEIREDVLDKFKKYDKFIVENKNKIFVDLKGIIRNQLLDLNIKNNNIEDDKVCTFDSDKYFSYRRDRPREVEAMIAIIGLVR
jgi:YfiH family protein